MQRYDTKLAYTHEYTMFNSDDGMYVTYADHLAREKELEQEITLLAEGIVELGMLIGVTDGLLPLTGPQVLLVLSDVKSWIKARAALGER